MKNLIDTCNYVSYTNTRLDTAITDTSNYVLSTSNNIARNAVKNLIDTSNYVSDTITRLDTAITDASNYVLSASNDITRYVVKNILDTSNQVTKHIHDSSNVAIGRVSVIENWVSHLTCDEIPQGTSNKFIVNNEYSSNLKILGTLTASNLNIIGTTTTIKTATYETENLEIVSQATDGPCLKVTQNGTQDVAQFFDGSTNVLTIRDGGNVGIGSTLPSEKLDVAGNIRVSGNIIPSVDITYDLGSASKRWKDLYMSGNTIYINNTRVSADPVTKGLIVKDDNNNLVDVTVASIKIKNAGTNSYSELKTMNNKISLVRYDTSGAEVDTTDIAATGVNTSNYVNTSVNSLNTTINTVDSNISNYVLSKVSPLEMLTKINENILNPVIWYQFNDDPFVAGSIITDSNTSSGTAKYNLTFTSNDGGSFDMSFYNDKNALEAWYQFDNNVIDSSSFHRAITASGSIQYSTDAARGTHSFNFNGSTSLSVANSNSVLTSYPLSICFWIKPIWASTGNYLNDLQTIFSTISGNYGLRFDIRNVSGVVDLFLGVYNNGAWLTGMTVLSNMQENQFNKWMHVAITLSSSSGGKGYVNGVLTSSATLANINLSAYPSASFNLSHQYFMKNGTKMDDLRIYSKILTASNVYVLYSSTVQKTTGYTANSYYYTNAYLYNALTTYANDNIYLAYTGSALNIQGLLNQFHNAEACSIHFVFKTANITSISQIFYIGNTSVGDLIRIYVNNASFTFKIGSAIATTVVTQDIWYVCDLVFTYAIGGSGGSGGNISLNIYMNGALVGSNNTIAYNNLLNNVNISGLVFYIGRYTDANDATPVILQDIRMYALAFTTNHISYLQYGSSSIPVGQWTATSNIRSLYYIGNVGIGTTLPNSSYKLDVLGNFKLTGTFNNITSNEISYLSGITSPVQSQINNTSNQISSRITLLDSNISNYISTKSSTSGGTSSQWTTNTGFINYNNVQVYPSEIRINNPAGVVIPSWVWYQFKSGLLVIDSSGNDRLLTNNGGTYALDSGRNSILLENGNDASLANADWSSFTDLSISGWFKASALADGDKLLEFKYSSIIQPLTTSPSITPVQIGNTNDYYIAFTTGSYTVTFNQSTTCDILVVGGGGGGGLNIGGGGGGGAVVYVTGANITAGTYTASVGSGGSGGTTSSADGGKGGNSSFAGIIAEGGGGGPTFGDGKNGLIGGSGGGAGGDGTSGAPGNTGGAKGTTSTLNGYTGTIYGNAGGDAQPRNGNFLAAGGGGGAGQVGTTGIVTASSDSAGNGGNGVQINIDGRNFYWGGGGGGSLFQWGTNKGGNGGLGGGGGGAFANPSNANGVVGISGTGGGSSLNSGVTPTSTNGGNGGANTGGGGGGCGWVPAPTVGGSGGSGIVIIRYNALVEKNILVKKVSTNLSFQINNTPIYTTPSFANNTWTHILWNIVNSSANGFVRLSTTEIGGENTYTKVIPTSGSYTNRLGSVTNVSSLNISDFRILTIPLTSTIKSELYSPTILYSTLVDDAYLTSTSNLISSRTTILDSNASNYTLQTSNQIANRITVLDSNVSNYTSTTSNQITSRITILDSNASNYTLSESNILRGLINGKANTLHNHAISDITNLSQSFTDTSNYVRAESNVLRTYTNTQIATLQTSLNNKENSFTILPVSKGGTSISTILANHLLGSGEVANTLQAITVGNGLSLSSGTLSANIISQWNNNSSGIFYNPTIVPVADQTNVGIGLSNPSFKLHVVGDINFTGTLRQNGTAFSSGASQWTTNGTIIHYNGGNVGIGTSSSTQILNLYKTGALSQRLFIKFTDDTTGSTDNDGCYVGKGDDNHLYILNFEPLKDIYFYAGGNRERMRIMGGTGDVCIGGITPANFLHLHKFSSGSPTGQNVLLQFTDDTTGQAGTNGCLIGKKSDHDFMIQNTRNANMLFLTNATERMRITNTGNVGIGNTNPTITLSVGGTNANHTMGRAIINANDIHNADKRDAFSIGRWDGTTLSNNFCGMRAVVDTGANTGEANDNHSFVSFHTWGNSIANSREVMRINQRGNLGLNTTQPRERLDLIGNLIVRSAAEATNATLFFGTPNNASAALKCAIIAQSINSWSRANLCFCLDDNTNNAASFNAGTNNIRMIILPSGNIGIGITNPSAKLHIYEATGTTHGANAGSIILDHDNNNGASSITFRSKINRGSDYGYIQYQDNTGSGENAKLIIGTQNDADDDVCLMPSGKVGIGTLNPLGTLSILGLPANSAVTNSTGTLVLSHNGGWDANSAGSSIVFTQRWFSGGAGDQVAVGMMNGVKTNNNGGFGGGLAFWTGPAGQNNLTEKMRIIDNGNVGIGNANPAARLDVASGSLSASFTNVRWFNYSGFSGQFPSTTIGNLCAIFRSDVMVQSQLVISSDSRIKKNIKDIDDDAALQKILAIQPKTYNYVDAIERGTSNVYGFIAQQVREVIPEAVKLQNEYIPNIYDSCTYTSNVLTFHNSNLNTTDIHIGSNIKLFDWDSKEHICKITDYTNTSITIDEDIQNTCNLCFAHGTQVDDFHALDKNYIYTLNVCATQELHKMIQKQNDIIASLLNRIEILENKQ